MKEWEQEAHASEYSCQESEHRWKDPSSWSWDAQDLSDKEIFARLTRPAMKVKAYADRLGLRSP